MGILLGILAATTAAISPVRAAEISSGVTFTQYTLSGPVKVYVVEVERFRSEYKLELGWAEHHRNYTNRQTVRTIAGLYDAPPAHDVLAAVNGSYFNFSGSGVTGMAGSEGEILEPPGGIRETFLIGPSRIPVITENINAANGTVTFADGTTTTLHGYNKTRAVNSLIAYTPQWAAATGSVEQGVEVLLTGVSYPMRGDKEISGIVTAVQTAAGSVNNAIPGGGLVLSATGTPVSTITSKTNVGDRLRIRIDTGTGACNNADMAVTGLGWILRSGLPYTENWQQYDSSYTARDPHTLLAWNSEKFFMLVCDGRTTASIGMSYQELATFLTTTLGATDAISLDGGGSSTMVVDGVLKNVPSDGSERSVANAIMLSRQVTTSSWPIGDTFPAPGRSSGWSDKFQYNPVEAFSPVSPGGDGYVIRVGNPLGGVETVSRGDYGDANYGVEADIYCEYRPDVASDGYERYTLFARDDGQGAMGLASIYGHGNCYALACDSNTGQMHAGRYLNGILLDSLSSPVFLPGTAWRKFRIDCSGSTITYRVDGQPVASITDSTFSRGFFGIGHHSFFSTKSNIHGTRADNFNAFSLPLPAKATIPDPAQYGSAITPSTGLNWTAGAGASSHNVYFGSANPPAFRGNQNATAYSPGALSSGVTYYWRIDEVGPGGKTRGDLWQFTTGLPAQAWTILHEPFQYAPYSTASPNYKYDPLAANLGGQSNPFNGLVWFSGPQGSGYDAYMVNENLDPPAPLPPSTGGAAVIYNGSAANNGICSRIQPGASEGMAVASGTLYYSMMLKVYECPANPTPNAGGFHAGFNSTAPTSSQNLTLAAARLRLRRTALDSKFQIGIESNTGNASTLVWDSSSYDNFTPMFVVVGYEMKNNTGSTPILTDDVSRLWINPAPATFGQASPPTASVSSTGADIDGGVVRSFFIRSQTSGTVSRVAFDELRIGVSWAAVTSDVACQPPGVTGVTPGSLPVGAPAVGVMVTGSNFVPGQSSVRLLLAGRPDVVASNVQVLNTNTLSCDLDLTSASPGKYDVSVTTCASAIFANAIVARSPQDLDSDGDVDGGDVELFISCISGGTVPHDGSLTCVQADFDHDDDVDEIDFGIIQRCLSGDGMPMEALCAD